MNYSCVLTTINKPNVKIINSLNLACRDNSRVIVVGDVKTPNLWKSTNFTYLGIEEQNYLFPSFSPEIKANHYSRKNLGYLFAAQQGNDWIFETDDDNFLLISPDIVFDKSKFAHKNIESLGWINPYKVFNTKRNIVNIWPRGFPLDFIHINHKKKSIDSSKYSPSLYQGIANGNPDVDAIFRLTSKNYSDFKFKKNLMLHLNQNQFTPINSQTTWWNKSIFRLMYLPSFSNFRVTDILRGYIASAIFSNKGIQMSLFSPVVFQDRNEHDLFSDFLQELPLYKSANSFMNKINEMIFAQDLSFSKFLVQAYKTAVDFGLTESEELNTLELWNEICDSMGITDNITS